MTTASSASSSPTTRTGSSSSILRSIPRAPVLLLRRLLLIALVVASLLLLLVSTTAATPPVRPVATAAVSPSHCYSARNGRRRLSLAACSFCLGTSAAANSSSSTSWTTRIVATMPPSPPPSIPPTAPAAVADESATEATEATDATDARVVVPTETTTAPKSDDAVPPDYSSTSAEPSGTNGKGKKVLYLIRHAETVENVQTQSLIRTGRSLSRLTRPHRDDVRNGMSVLKSWVKGHADSGLSDLGRRQVEKTGRVLQSEGGMDFLKTHGITTVAHSPLERARLTSAGVLGCVASPQDPSAEFVEEMKHEDVGRVVQLDCLREATPHELAIPRKKRTFYDRMREFERWVEAQDDGERIAVVGHSHFFMEMLNLSEKFRNCDVWKVEFSPPPPPPPSSPSAAVEAEGGDRNGDGPPGEGGARSSASGVDGEQRQQSQTRRPSSSYGSTYSSPCRWSGLELVYRYEEDGNDDGDGDVTRRD